MGAWRCAKEGEWWVAYYAQPHTMDKAIELARIRMMLITGDKHRGAKEDFMALMRSVVDALLKDVTGQTPSWSGERTAPESERSGHS